MAATATEAAVVLLPLPPFWVTNEITCNGLALIMAQHYNCIRRHNYAIAK